MESAFPGVGFRWIASHPIQTVEKPGYIDLNHDLRVTVSNASIIICATSSTSPLFPSSWVRAGTHVILIGSYTRAMHEVDSDLVQRAVLKPQQPGQRPPHKQSQILLVDSREACAVEAGELIKAGVAGSDVVEIGEMVKVGEGGELVNLRLELGGPADNRDEEWEGDVGTGPITMFKSVGVGLQDVAIACAVVGKAEEMGIGMRVAEYDSC